MTYRELAEIINKLSDEQKDMNAIAYNEISENFSFIEDAIERPEVKVGLGQVYPSRKQIVLKVKFLTNRTSKGR